MTEDEARGKECRPGGRTHRFGKEFAECIASDCACWVHEKSIWCNKDGRQVEVGLLAERTPYDDGLITVSFGHCGLIK